MRLKKVSSRTIHLVRTRSKRRQQIILTVNRLSRGMSMRHRMNATGQLTTMTRHQCHHIICRTMTTRQCYSKYVTSQQSKSSRWVDGGTGRVGQLQVSGCVRVCLELLRLKCTRTWIPVNTVWVWADRPCKYLSTCQSAARIIVGTCTWSVSTCSRHPAGQS